MAVPGKPCPYTKVEIVEALVKHEGRMCPAAKSLGLCYQTVKNFYDAHEDIKQLVDDMRKDFEETLLDSAESVLVFAMNRKDEDMTNALKATIFTLNNKGKPRGYHPPVINQQGDIKITPSQLAQVSAEMKKHSEEKKNE